MSQDSAAGDHSPPAQTTQAPPQEPEGSAAGEPPREEQRRTSTPAGDQPASPDDASDRTNRFSGASTDRHAPERRAYRSSRARYQSTASIHDSALAGILGSVVGEMQVGDRFIRNYFAPAGTGARLLPGPVRDEVLADVRARYVPVPGYQRLQDALRARHLLVLRGLPDTGRATTGLHLLDHAAGGKVARLDPEKEIHTIGESDLEQGRGYLLDRLTDAASEALQETQLDRLSALLQRHGCFCVAVADLDPVRPGSLGGYIHDCAAPDIWDVLMSHVIWSIRDHPDGGLAQRLRGIAEQPQTRRSLGPAPRMAEVVEFAEVLVRHGRDGLAYRQVLLRCEHLVVALVIEWFSHLRHASRDTSMDQEIRLASFRIALAVFNGLPNNEVAEAADQLAQEMAEGVTAGQPCVRTPLGEDRRRQLPALRAELRSEVVERIPGVSVPVETIRFKDSRYPRMILTYLWRRHDAMRAPLIAWLTKLSTDSQVDVWIGAAQALGVICALDFPSVFNRHVSEWANADEWPQRMTAAVALDEAARDHRIRPAVEAILRRWVRTGTDAERWTAAAALGHDIGLVDPERSLDELRIIGTWESRTFASTADLVAIAGFSASTLFDAGAVEPVLRAVRAWLHDRRCRDLALMTILWIMVTWSDAADLSAHGVGADRRSWPLVLAIHERDRSLGRQFADLAWHALRLSPAQEIALEVLTRWIRRGERDPGCLEEIGRFLPLLVDDEADERRLLHLLTTMRHAWIDPLQPDVAEQLEAAVRHARAGTPRRPTARRLETDGRHPTS